VDWILKPFPQVKEHAFGAILSFRSMDSHGGWIASSTELVESSSTT
jgi:hypothetical protein